MNRLLLGLIAFGVFQTAQGLNVMTCTDTPSVAGKSAEPWPACKGFTKVAVGSATVVLVNPINSATTTPQWVTPSTIPDGWYVFTDTAQTNGQDWVLASLVYPPTPVNHVTTPASPPVSAPMLTLVASITWTAPTTNAVVPPATVGTPIIVPLTYNIYRAAGTSSSAVIGTSATPSYTDTVPFAATYTYTVTAVECTPPVVSTQSAVCNESAPSNAVTVMLAAPPIPGSPLQLIVQ